MPITLSSTSGGYVDPYIGDDGFSSGFTFPKAAIENESYVDVALVTPESGYVAVVSTSVSASGVTDISVSSSEVSSGPLNEPHTNQPATGPFSGTTISAGSPTITFSGTLGNVFNDLYWKTMDLTNMSSTINTNRGITTAGDKSLYVYKPSYARYALRTYTVTSVHVDPLGNPATFTYTILKRVLNLWDINRATMISIVQQQDQYRTDNYPKA